MFPKLTLRRLSNAIKVGISFHFSRILKRNLSWGLPVSISLEPTTACNLGCPECPSGLKKFTRNTGNLKSDFAKDILNELAPHLMYANFYFQGEPFINPGFLDMVKYAAKKGIYTSTSTNAHFLHPELAKKTVESGLDKLIISIDGITQETYSSYRIGGKLEKVIEGTQNILYWRNELKSKTPYVIFQFLVVKPNEHEIESAKKLADEIGVDEIRFKTTQVYDYEFGNPLIPENENYSRYRKLPNGKYEIKNKLVNQCWRMWQGCVITWDGLVVPCCFDKDATHKLGQAGETPFRDIWKGEKYRNFRRAILKSRKEIDICRNCSEGTKVWT
ncbi:MAG: radical SAM/SPASM domain-containing protein [Flavobacteriales bacterium]